MRQWLGLYQLDKPAVSGYSDMELDQFDPCYMFIHVWSSILLVFHSDKKSQDSKFPGMMNQYGRLLRFDLCLIFVEMSLAMGSCWLGTLDLPVYFPFNSTEPQWSTY